MHKANKLFTTVNSLLGKKPSIQQKAEEKSGYFTGELTFNNQKTAHYTNNYPTDPIPRTDEKGQALPAKK